MGSERVSATDLRMDFYEKFQSGKNVGLLCDAAVACKMYWMAAELGLPVLVQYAICGFAATRLARALLAWQRTWTVDCATVAPDVSIRRAFNTAARKVLGQERSGRAFWREFAKSSPAWPSNFVSVEDCEWAFMERKGFCAGLEQSIVLPTTLKFIYGLVSRSSPRLG